MPFKISQFKISKFKVSQKIVVASLVVLLVLGITLLVMLTPLHWSSPCANRQVVDSSLFVKTIPTRAYFGMNTDRESLNFGAASPGTEITRSIFVQYSKETDVIVRMLGDLSSWTLIKPQRFHLPFNHSEQVSFTVMVPTWAKDGNYTGKAEFCFRE